MSTTNSTGRESARFGNPQMPTSNASNMNAFQEQKCSPRASVDTHNCNRNEKSKADCSAPSRRPYLRRTSSGSDGADVTRPHRAPSRSSQLSSFSSPQPEHMVNLSASIPRKAACQSTTGANSDEDFSIFPPPSQTTLLPSVQQSVTLPTEQRMTIPTSHSITLPTAEAILIPAADSILLPTAEGILLPTAHPESWAYYEDDVDKSVDIFPVYQHGAAAPRARYRIVFCDGPMCRWETEGIVGPRFMCAECPSSVDLCEACYTSQTAHDSSHAFKRFDQPDVTTYTMCPPQKTRPEQHSNVFCDGLMCRGATQCIVGPRYMCANCPPTVDLCQRCYLSRDAHNPSHSFKRFDKAGIPAYVLCPPSSSVGSTSEADDGLLTFARDSLVDYVASTVQPLQVNRINEPCLNPGIANHDTSSQDGSYWV
jgi:hypothetical protein